MGKLTCILLILIPCFRYLSRYFDIFICDTMIDHVLNDTALAGTSVSFVGATGEYFYHSNISTPRWFEYFIQRPGHLSIHHQLDVHKYNFGDITRWDRIFGTFKEAADFGPDCGFPKNNESEVWHMLKFKDLYNS